MSPALLAVALIAYVVGRRWLRSWVTSRWLDGRISDRQAGLLFGLIWMAPLLAILVILAVSMRGASLVLVLGVLPAAIVVIGLIGAVMDYMTAHGVKDSMDDADSA